MTGSCSRTTSRCTIVDHYGPGEAAVRAFLAGCDMLLICKERDREIAARGRGAVAAGTIDTARLDQSVARIQRIKQRYLCRTGRR